MSNFRDALKTGEFVVTCEFVPGRGREGVSVDAALQFAKAVSASGAGIHAVSLTDNPGGNPAITPDALAPAIRETGIETLVHFSCRDLNRNAVESRATALSRAGVQNLLVLTGDYTAGGYQGNAAPVFDLDAVQGIRYLKAMNEGLEVPGMKKGTTARLPKTDFFLGAAVSPFKVKEEELYAQFFKLEKKVAAGADFIITQLGYDMRKFLEVKRYMALRNIKVPLIGNVYVLSFGAAKTMNGGGVPGCVVTDELVKVLEEESKDPDKGKGKRLERAAKMMAMFKGMGFNGVHIGGFALKTDDFLYIIRRAAELEPRWQEFVPEVSFGAKDEFYAFPPPVAGVAPAGTPDSLAPVRRQRKIFAYGIMSGFHSVMFEPDSLGFKMMRGYYRATRKLKHFTGFSHGCEYLAKMAMFGCRDCGDCALADMAYCCPQSRCAKQQRNGACGGSVNGMCEVYPDEKPCVWTLVYLRLKSVNRLDEMRTSYVPPRKNELSYTSGWANYYLGLDHAHVGNEKAPEKEAGASVH